MDEVAVLYAMLANDGSPQPLQLLAGEEPGAAERPAEKLLTSAACFLVRDMLLPAAPPLPGEGFTSGFSRVSWKTGTSNGFRDAWAAAVCGDFVLVVWLGNFSGKSNPAFNGRASAGPLLFQILARLNLPAVEGSRPPEAAKVDLCAVSGELPGPHCPHRVEGWYLPGTSPIASCSLHKEIYIDGQTGLRVASNDGRPGLRREVCECWPPSMLELFRQAGVPRREPPPLESRSTPDGKAPRIASPNRSLTYSFRASDPARRSVPLQAEAAAGVRRVFWFSGTQFIGASDPGLPLLWSPLPGVSTLRVVDDQGRAATRDIRVEMLP